MKLVCKCWIPSFYQRITACAFLFLVLNRVTCARQEIRQHSFDELLEIVKNGDIRERRDVTEEEEESSGVDPDKEGAPEIMISEQKKFVVRKKSKIEVDVGSTVYAVRETHITVLCKASADGQTQPKVKWLRYDKPMTGRFQGDVAAVNGKLIIRRLGRFNEGSYTCRASNSKGSDEAIFSAKILVPSLPTILTVNEDLKFGPSDKEAVITVGSNVTVYRGTTLTIRCPVETGNPVIFWTSKDKSVSIGKAVKVGNDLVINDIDKRYALDYKCTARAPRGRVSATSTVNVLALDPPRIKGGKKVLKVLEDDNIKVTIDVGSNLTAISETQVIVRCVASMKPSPALSWRVQQTKILSLSEDNTTLTITDPRVEDTGLYTCVASNNIGQDSKTSYIQILPPEPPTISYSNRMVTKLRQSDALQTTIGDQVTMLAGGTVSIKCPTSGLPSPTVKWSKDGEELTNRSNVTYTESESRLKIYNATAQDSGVFTCEAVNRAGRFSYSSTLKVIAAEKPEIQSSSGRVLGLQGIEEAFVKIGEDLRVVEGLIVRLVCPVSGFPTPQVTWLMNGEKVETTERFLIDWRTNSLVINGIELQETGQVSCVAENIAGRAEEASFISILSESSAQVLAGNRSVLSIKDMKPITIQIGDRLRVLSSSNVFIDCSARGTPPPVVNWRRDGRAVRSGDREGQFEIRDTSDGSRLSIWQISEEVAGQYECVATNLGGADRVASVITVLEGSPPKIEFSSKSKTYLENLDPASVSAGSRVTLLPGVVLEITCTASGVPEPVIGWLKQGKPITSRGRFISRGGVLIINSTRPQDNGAYTCVAENSLGMDAFDSIVDVIKPVEPTITETGQDIVVDLASRLSQVVGGNILSIEGVDLELTCSVEGKPIPDVTWMRGNEVVEKGRILRLGIVKEQNTGNYSCVASNVGGQDKKTTKLTVKKAIPPKIQRGVTTVESFEEQVMITVDVGTRLRVTQGAYIDLVCRVTGFPIPRVSWVIGNEPLDERFERQGFYSAEFNGTSTTLFVRAARTSQDEVYGCTASSTGGTTAVYSYVKFFERTPPTVESTWLTGSVGIRESLKSREPITITIGDTLRLLTKTQVTIKCPVYAVPVAKVEWTKDKKSLPEKHRANGTNLVLSKESDLSDSGRYSCTATNGLGRDSSWSDVTFTEPTPPSIFVGDSSVQLLSPVNYRARVGSNITTMEGNNITLVCESEGLPTPTVSWEKDGVDLNFTEIMYTVYASSVKLSGAFSCVAKNLGGFIVSTSNVEVLDDILKVTATVPRIITSRKNQPNPDDRRTVEQIIGGNVTVLEGRNLLLRCPVEGIPDPDVTWLFEGSPMQVSDTVQIDSATGHLKIIEMTEDDVGQYSCVAKNIAGETTEVSYTTVIEPTFPVIESSNESIKWFDPGRKPLTVKVGGNVVTLVGTVVSITCRASGLPQPKISWVKGLTGFADNNNERITEAGDQITFRNPTKSDSGLYMCTATSPGGEVSEVTNITFVSSVRPKILFSKRERQILERRTVNITIGEKLTILDQSNVTLGCNAIGVPSPTISWRKNNIPLPSVDNVWVIRNILPEQAGLYKCTAKNYLGAESQSSEISVAVGRKPTITSKNINFVRLDKLASIELDIGSNITFISGSRLVLVCQADGTPTPAITWKLNGVPIEENTNESTLILEDIALDDLKTTSCVASNVLGSASKASFFAQLEPSKPLVEIPVSPKVIESQGGNPVTMSIGDNVTALCNTTITIECPTSGVPRPTVTWKKDGQEILNDTTHTVRDDGSLVIHGAHVKESARYTCFADSSFGRDSAESTVTFVEPVKPSLRIPQTGRELPIGDGSPVTMNIGDNVTAASETRITIKCPVDGLPKPRVSWNKDGVEITSGENILITDDNSLVIEKASVEDSAKYTCKIENLAGTDSASSSVVIQGRSKPVIKLPSTPRTVDGQDGNPVTMTIGDNVTALSNTSIAIECPTSGVPRPTVTWKKDSQGIFRDARYTIRDDGSLVIVGANEEDSALYTCTAKSDAGRDNASSVVQIVEPVKPSIKIPQTGRELPIGDGSPVTMNIGDNVTAPSETRITIKCPVDGLPKPRVSWNKDGVEITSGERFLITDDNSLVIEKASVADSAKYSCNIENLAGTDSASSSVAIEDRSKPVVKLRSTPRTVDGQDGNPVTMTIGDNVTALSNTSITIECPTSGVPRPTVTWKKDGQEIFSDARYTIRDDGSLVIGGANAEDSALYTCTAESDAGRDNASSMVHIVEPVKPSIKIPQTGRELPIGDGSPVTMNIGDNVTAASETRITIKCPVDGLPKPRVSWNKDGVEITSGERFLITNDNSLKIEKASVKDSAKYTCNIENLAGTDSASSSVAIEDRSEPVVKLPSTPRTVDGQDGNPVTMTIGDNVTALSNTSITIECPTSGVPRPNVTWKKDGQEIFSDGRYTIRDDGSLVIVGANEEDSALYTCTAESDAGRDNASSMVHIVEPVKPSIKIPQTGRELPIGDGSPVTMNIGDNVTAPSETRITIKCPVDGLPKPRVSWNKDGVEITSGERFLITDDNSLVIEKASVEDSAKYSCNIENLAGTDSASSSVAIEGRSKPVVKLPSTERTVDGQDGNPVTMTIGDNVTALSNTSITIECPTRGVPRPSITWKKDGQEIFSDGRYTIRDDGSLVIVGANEEDSALYTCTAESDAGRDNASSMVQFVEPVKPSIKIPQTGRELPIGDGSPVTMNIGDNVTAPSETRITIKCPVDGLPKPRVSWNKDGVEITSGERFLITDDNSLVIEKASVEDSAKYTCNIENLAGTDSASSSVAIEDRSKPVVKLPLTPRTVDGQDGNPVTMTIGDNVTALSNTSITIECPTSGVPRPTVTWKKDGQEIFSDGGYTIRDNGSLVIGGASVEDSGLYTCTAESDAGRDIASSMVHIVEPVKPSIKIPESGRELPIGDGSPVTMNIGDNVTAPSETRITIKCPVDGLPKPRVSWNKDGVEITSGERFLITDDNSLVIEKASVEDSAKYTCNIENLAGTDSASSSVAIEDRSKPVVKLPLTPRTVDGQDGNPVTMTIGDNVTALSNTSITIECPTSGVPRPTVTWKKDGQEIFSDGRYTIRDNGSLVIGGASVEDSALYTCTAESDAGRDIASSMVHIVEPVKPSIKIPESGRELPIGDGSPVTMNIGDNVTAPSETRITIKCPVDGLPKPRVSWNKDGVEITSGERFLITDDNSLVIEKASVEDSAKYTCNIENLAGTDSASSSVAIEDRSKPVVKLPLTPRTVDGQDGNPVTMTIGDNVTALSNTSITIECPTSGVPRPTVTWKKDGQEIFSDGRYTIRDNGSLVIGGASVEDSALYTCTAESDAGRDIASSMVHIVEPVKPSIKIPESGRELPIGDGSPVTMNIGDNVTAPSETRITIKCPVDGLPKPRVSWNKDGVEITSGERFLITDDNSLVIEKASVEDSAKYTCNIENLAGTDSTSSSVAIEDRSKPVVKLPLTPRTVDGQDGNPVTMTIGDNVTALSNTSITIECPTSGVPRPTVTWKKDGQEIFSDGRYTIRDNGSLVIGGASVEDSALYTCTAESDAGRDIASSMVHIVEPVKPSIKILESGRELPIGDGSPVTMNIGDNVTAPSETRITIKCPVDGLPKPRVSWNKDGVEITSGERFLITDDNSLVIEKASVEDSAKYTCNIENLAGTDSASSSVVIKEPTQPRIDSSSGNVESLNKDPVNITVGQNLLTLIESQLSISCPVRGLPLPKVTWKKGNETLPFDGRMAIRNHTLFIVELESSDTGTYTCYAENSLGTAAVSSNVTVEAPFPLEIVRTRVEDLRVLVPTSIDAFVGSSILTVHGSNVSLFCEVNGFPPPLINWLKDNSPLDIKGPFLELPAVTAEDSGLYKCVATSPLGFNDSLTTNVTVIDLRRPTVITNKDDLEVFKMENFSAAVGGLVSTLDGNRVSLKCEVSGIPTPRITWQKDDIEVQSGGKEYVIDRARRNDSGMYTCIATNIAGAEVASTNLSVIVGSVPRISASQDDMTFMEIDLFTITIGSNLTTLASSALEIKCPVTGFPQPDIRWYREGAPVHPGLMLKVDNTTGTLTALSVSQRKGGTFTCKASNVLGSANASSVVTILAAVEPQINVSDGKVLSRDRNPVSVVIGVVVAVLNGTRVSIECTVNGVPRPAIRWSHDDKPLNSSERILIQESALTINGVTTEDNGVYFCKAVNIAGDDLASSILNVTESSPPRISSTDQPQAIFSSGSFTVDIGTNVTTVAGNTLGIRCKASGVPSPHISWTKDGSMIDAKGQLLNIRALNLSDTGRYQCIASNIDGTDVQELNLEVLAATAPRIITAEENIVAVDGVKNINVDVGGNVTTIIGSSVEIACVTTGLPNATVTWLFNGSRAEDEGFRSINPANKAVLVTSVTPSYVGLYTCIASNAIGSDSKSSFLSIIVPEEPKIIPSNKNITDFSTAEQTLSIGDNLETLEGVTVTITCPHTGRPTPDILWEKSGVVLTTNSRFKVLNEALTINNARQSDTGSYTCTATNGAGSDKKTTLIKFKVSEKPLITGDGIDIESYNREPLQVNVGRKLKVLENTLVTINCTASGIPVPTVYWYRDGNNRMNEEGGNLEFADIQVEDSGNYTCRAVNKAGEDVRSSVIEVIAPTPPSILKTTGNVSWYDKEPRSLSVGGNLEVLSGTNVTLQCESSGFPQPEVMWTTLDREENTVKQNNRHQITNSSLVVYKVRPADSGLYLCTVRNLAGTSSVATRLRVIEPRAPTIISSQEDIVSLSDNRVPVQAVVGSTITVLIGSQVTVTCPAEGIPSPTITWGRQNETVFTPTQNKDKDQLEVLQINDASVEDSGDYVCRAQSEAGVDMESTRIIIIEPSMPSIKQPEVDSVAVTNESLVIVPVGSDVTVLTNTRVNITCEVDGVPSPNVRWLKAGEPTSPTDSSFLIITMTTLQDAGQYTCVAENMAGNASLSSDIKVIDPLFPRILSGTGEVIALSERQSVTGFVGVTVETFTSTTLTLLCEAEGSPAPALSWSKEGQLIVSKDRVSIQEDGTLVITNTHVGDSGTYQCSARNVLGVTVVESPVYIVAPIPPKIKESKSYIIWYEKQQFKGRIGDNLTTMKGRMLTLICPAVGLPSPVIGWFRGGMRMTKGHNYHVNGQKLIIYNLDVTDTDRYTCMAKNFAGITSATSTLKVHEPMTPEIVSSFGSVDSLEDQRPLNIKIGTDATLLSGSPLSIKCPVVGVPEPKISWVKDNQVLFSNERMEIDCNGTLTIFATEIKDSGDYVCSADSFLGMDLAFSAVTVIEALRPSVDASQRSLYISSGNLVDLNVGDNLTAITTTPVNLSCPTTGVPKPSVFWQMNGNPLETSGNYETDDNGVLVIRELTDPGQYTCIAENFLGKDDASSYITILDTQTPVIEIPQTGRQIPIGDGSPVTMNIGDNVTAASETTITIKCPVDGLPKPRVSWNKDGVQIISGEKFLITDDNSLVIEEASVEDSAKYTCKIENLVGTDSASSSVVIEDRSKPVVKLPSTPRTVDGQDGNPVTMTIGDNVTALSNTSITIECPTSGVPRPNVTWKKDDQEILSDARYTIRDNGSLVIGGASVEDSALYTCTAESDAGRDNASSMVQIVSPRKPSIEIPQTWRQIPIGDGSPVTMNIGDNVTAASETTITIKCPVDGSPKPSATWNKDGVQIISGEKFLITDDNSLVIEEASVEDSAKYTCKIENFAGTDNASSLVLIEDRSKPVVKLPSTPRTVDGQDGNPVTMTIGDNVTALSNTSITIECPTSGVPRPTVTWKKDDQEIFSDGRYTIRDNGSLVIGGANAEDSALYTCTAESDAGRDNASSMVQIVAPRKPSIEIPQTGRQIPIGDGSPVTMNIGDNVTAASETTITIKCPVDGSPKPSVTWNKDGVQITSGENFLITNDNSLVIEEASVEDSAEYTCKIENVAGTDSASSSVKIVVLKRPTILVPLPGPGLFFGDGSPVKTTVGSRISEFAYVKISLTCPTEGLPPPSVSWLKDEKELTSGGRIVIDKSDTLTIRDAVAQDSGKYTCVAKNLAGATEVESSISIVEPLAPIIEPPIGKVVSDDYRMVKASVGTKIDAFRGATIEITCLVRGVPKPEVNWSKNNQRVLTGERILVLSNGTLIIRDSSLDDSGKYTCSANSSVGQDNATSEVSITAPSKPMIQKSVEEIIWNNVSVLSAAVGSSVELFNGSSVVLMCNSSGYPPPQLNWTRGLKDLSSNGSSFIISGHSLTISNVQLDDADEYTCTATNQFGQDAATTELIIRVPEQPVILSEKRDLVDMDTSRPIDVTIGSSLTTVVNATVVINCPSMGIPKPMISWGYGQEPLVPGIKYNMTASSLIMNLVQHRDGGRYKCEASSSFGSDSEYFNLTVTVPPVINNVKGTFEIIDIRDLVSITTGAVVTIPIGVSVKIQCVANGVPVPKITWYRQPEGSNQRDLVTSSSAVRILDDNSISISHTEVADAAEYICVATNIAGRDEGTTLLNIGTPPAIPSRWRGIQSRFREIAAGRLDTSIGAVASVIKGATLNIKCAAVGNPKPQITWTVATAGRLQRYRVLADGTLEVPRAELDDEGNYTCIANNSYGTLNRTTSVNILVPPEILERHFRHVVVEEVLDFRPVTQMEVKRNETSSVTIERGNNLILICTVRGRPKPQVTWRKNRTLIRNDTRHLILPNGVLLVHHVDIEESGQYKCVASNIAGRDQGTVELVVKDKVFGWWKTLRWSECGSCFANLRGWQERNISCVDQSGDPISDSHCADVPKPIAKRPCTSSKCVVIWWSSPWSACSMTCGSHGIKLRNVRCVFVKSLKPANELCDSSKKPPWREECNRISCKGNCEDRVKYCGRVKRMGLCRVYSRWCCRTC